MDCWSTVLLPRSKEIHWQEILHKSIISLPHPGGQRKNPSQSFQLNES